MTKDRAREINSRLVQAWMLREGLANGPMPDLSDVSLAEAEKASRLVADDSREASERPGFRPLLCHVEVTRVRPLFAWALLHA